MDDKTFIAKYVADESTRVKDRLKAIVERDTPLSETEKESVIKDMEETLRRMQSALSHITPEMLENLDEDKKLDA